MGLQKYIAVNLKCDNCGCTESLEKNIVGKTRSADIEKDAIREGWLIDQNGHVLCPICHKIEKNKIKNEKQERDK